jgi:hypothetical protein
VCAHTKGRCSSKTVSKENSVGAAILRRLEKGFLCKKGLLLRNHRNYLGMVDPETVLINPKFCKKRLFARKTGKIGLPVNNLTRQKR